MSIKSKDRIYSTSTAADFLGLQQDTVRQYVHRGILKPIGSIGRGYVFEESELKRYQTEKKSRGRQKSA